MLSFWRRLIAPRSADPMTQRREAALYVLIFSGLAAAVLWLAAGLLFLSFVGPHRRIVGDIVVGLEGLAFSTIAYGIARRGATRASVYTALLGLLAMQVSSMFLIWQHPLDPTLVFYPLIIALGGLLLGRNGALFFYLCSLFVYIASALWLYLNGFRQTAIEQASTLPMLFLMLALMLGMLLLVINIYIRSLEQALGGAEELVQARTRELRGAYQDMAQQRARLDVILRNIADGLVVTDLEGRVVQVNPAFVTIVGRPAPELIGQRLGQIVPNETLVQIVDQAREEPGAVCTGNAAWSERVYQASACALSGPEGTPGGVVTILHDITQEVMAIEARTQFISTVAHELRTPLSSVQGFSELLLDGLGTTPPEEQRACLGAIRRAAERMAALVRDLLDLCALESGRARVEIAPTGVYSAVEEVAIAMRPQLAEKALQMEVALPPELPPVLADPGRLNQILANLVANACQYTPTGGKIGVRARWVPSAPADSRRYPKEGGSYIEIAVWDTGIGIPPEDCERIFERFTRLDHPLVRQAGGAGLGLTVVRQLLHLQGGRVWVEGAPGQGSTFSFTLPTAEL